MFSMLVCNYNTERDKKSQQYYHNKENEIHTSVFSKYRVVSSMNERTNNEISQLHENYARLPETSTQVTFKLPQWLLFVSSVGLLSAWLSIIYFLFGFIVCLFFLSFFFCLHKMLLNKAEKGGHFTETSPIVTSK